jgi:hypothetical protein
MTPGRATTLYGRWKWAGAATIVIAMALSFVSIAYFTAPLTVIGVLCLLEARECGGWRDGYLARMRREAEDRADASGNLRGEPR